MNCVSYDKWVRRLAAHEPGSPAWKVVAEDCLVSLEHRGVGTVERYAAVDYVIKEARKLYEERRQQIYAAERALDKPLIARDDPCKVVGDCFRPGKMNWISEAADWPTEYKCDLMRYGRSPDSTYYRYEFRPRRYGKSIVEQAMRDLAMCGNAFIKFNTEGEKQMEKIDWHKPLRSLKPGRGENPKVYTYKSGKQRVVWIDDRVYPVDEQGRAVADVWYDQYSRPAVGTSKGAKIVENAPEEKFFLGLYRVGGFYAITDCGQPTTMNVLEGWKRSFLFHEPNWIVDTRKSAEPPKAIVHDPKDYVAVYWDANGHVEVADELMTKREAECRSSADAVVRVRTTPPPADTARYIQLWRVHPSDPWRINARGPAHGGSQEFTWAETQHRGVSPTQCAIKVRD